MTDKPSLPPSHFEALYQANPDPWQFTTSEYEAQKYAATLAALPRLRYQSGFEIGGSIGVLTAQLADRCQQLLSVDVSKLAQDQAIQRCQQLPQVQFQLMTIPQEYPDRRFDLILLSEVGYYWCWTDLHKAEQCILQSLEPQGHLLLVHWTVDAVECPLTGDQVHDSFSTLVGLHHLHSDRTDRYRLDLFERMSK